jgi:hypothetical protein
MGWQMIIGLSGKAGAGKDTVANILVEHYGYRRVAFADKIRECLFALDPIVTARAEYPLHLSEYFDDFGWERTKQLPEVRRLMQTFGTEVGRNLIDANLWIELALGDVEPDHKVVVTDVRFPDEADNVKWLFGEVWRVERKVAPVNNHISETALDDWVFDRVIDNSGTIQDLEITIEELMGVEK